MSCIPYLTYLGGFLIKNIIFLKANYCLVLKSKHLYKIIIFNFIIVNGFYFNQYKILFDYKN